MKVSNQFRFYTHEADPDCGADPDDNGEIMCWSERYATIASGETVDAAIARTLRSISLELRSRGGCLLMWIPDHDEMPRLIAAGAARQAREPSIALARAIADARSLLRVDWFNRGGPFAAQPELRGLSAHEVEHNLAVLLVGVPQ